jgi:leucyl/phenylalanyl-tRNA--protein transferase
MARSGDSPYVSWVCPEMRGQLSIANLHVPRKLKKLLLKQELNGKPYEIRINHDFEGVIRACAAAKPHRPETWINAPIIKAYCKLHTDGHAHSLEVWQDQSMVGGVYGIAMGGAFFGESMFSNVPNASKVVLVHLAARLWRGGFELLDTQFVNEHLKQFGAYEVPYADYRKQLVRSLSLSADFFLKDLNEEKLIRDYFERRSASTSTAST